MLFGSILGKLDELLVGQANLASQIGVLRMSTQADAAALAQAIQADTTAWQAWATNVQTVITNVEAALAAAQAQIAAGGSVDLTDAQNAVTAAQAAVGALPVETDPTVTPPAPTPGS